MTYLTIHYGRYKAYVVPGLIVLVSIVISGYLIHAKIAHAGLTYGWSVSHDCFDAGWPPGCNTTDYSPGGCLGGCSAANVGEHCQRLQCSSLPASCTGDFINIDCVVTGCTPDNSCAANTCTSATCPDGCGGFVAGTKTTGSCAAPPPPTCTPDASCAANTCNTGTCTATAGDCSTYQTPGTKVCVGPPPTCNNPTASITATPSRVKSGQTAVLKITGTGLTNSCTVTGPGVNQTLSPSSCNLSPNPTTITTPGITVQSTYKVTCTDIVSATTTIVNLNPVFTPF